MISRTQGTVYLVVYFPSDWPVAVRSRLNRQADDTSAFELTAEPDGSLRFTVSDSGGLIEHRTQRLRVTGAGWALVRCVWWPPGNTAVFINGNQTQLRAATDDVVDVETRSHDIGREPAWQSADAVVACATWIAWRKTRFATTRAPRPGRRPKSQAEQLAELEQATRALGDIANLVRSGQIHLVGHLAAALRALVYWNGRTHDPLLLRLASRVDAPLPIYLLREELPPVLEGLVSDLRGGYPSIVRELPKHVVADLQEWLTSTVLTHSSGGSPAPALEHLIAKDVIAGVADTLGVAHYDQDIPVAVERLSRFYGPDTDAVTRVLLTAASVVIPLSLYIQQQLAAT